MLTMMRELLRSKFAGILFGLIIVSMAVWGVTDIFNGSLGSQVVKAGPRGFTMAEFDVRVEQLLQRQRDQGGIMSRREAVEQGAVDQLFAVHASRMANLGYAKSIGVESTTDGVWENVRSDEEFADPISGNFDSDLYRRVLRSYQYTPEEYLRLLQDETTLGLLRGSYASALRPPQAYSNLQATYLAESRDLSWFVIDRSDVGEAEPPTEEDLQAYYEEHLDGFRIPERRVISVLSLSAEDFVHTVEVSTEDLRAIYEAQKAQRFSGPETRHFVEVVTRSEVAARDAFGRLAGGATPESFTGASTASVNARAARRSEIANTELATQLFQEQARIGTVVGPIRQGDLWLVARLDEVVPGIPVPFESVSDLIQEEYARAEAENLFLQAEANIFDLIGAGYTLKEMGTELGAPVITYVPLSQRARMEDGRAIPGLAANAQLMQAAFEGRLGQVSDPIDGENRIFMVEVQSVLPPRTPDLAEIRDRVEVAYIASRDSEGLSRFARGLAEEIELGGRSMAEVADGLGKDLEGTQRSISRANYEGQAPSGILVPAFGANEGDVFTVPGPGADQVTIARLDAINPPGSSDVTMLGGLVSAEIQQSLENDLRYAMEAEFREAVDFKANTAALEVYKQQILDQQ
ncbi:MAG: peptidyl-prolyl cis-trans isomerase [Hyphomonadaceae bacterium]|nr:peptidyl-prolyl cis-trans isomerase [Hyphomonadaceae bacterium]